jgi:hypothetical protein
MMVDICLHAREHARKNRLHGHACGLIEQRSNDAVRE